MTRDFNPAFLKLNIIDMDDILRDPQLQQTCLSLSCGPGFGMTKFITNYKEVVKERSVDALGVLAFYQSSPVGWLLYTYERDYVCFDPRKYDDENAACHLFVHQDWRRLGIGTRLLQMAAKLAEPHSARVYAWENEQFFMPLIEQHQSLRSI